MPVVVLADSGGAATAIYDYIMGGIEDVEEKFKAKEGQFSQIKQLNDAHSRAASSEVLRSQCTTLSRSPGSEVPTARGRRPAVHPAAAYAFTTLSLPSVADKSQIQFFSLKGGHYGSSDLSSCLLKSIIDMMNTIPKSEEFPEGSTARASDGGGITRDAEMDKQDRELRRTLGLTVTWDAPNLAHMILANMHTLTKADNKEIGTLRTVGVTLQLALEMQRAKIVKLLCELPGFTVQSINMGRLYSTKDEAGFLTNHKQLQDKIHTYRRDMFAPDKKKMHYVLYQKAVQRFMYNINPILLRLLRQNSVTQVHDVFFWLVCQGNEEMARAMWAKCVMPVHIALLGAAIATSKAGALAEPAKTSALELSLTLQTWAYGLLDIADQAHATKILELEVCESFIRPNTCMDVAMATGAKMFLTQRHCVRLMDCHWRGGIPGSSITISPQFNYVALTLYAVLPPLNPYLWKMTEKKREQRKAAKNATRSDSVIDAIGMVFRVLGEGRTTERVHNEARRMHKAESTMFQIKSLWVTDLFGPSAGQHQQAEEDTHQTTKIMSFYSAPVVKFTLRFLVHAANCALYIALVLAFQGPDELASKKAACDELDDPRPCLATHMPSMFDGNVTEVMWLIFEFGLFSDFKHQSLQRIRKRLPAKIGVGRLAYLSDLFVVVSFSLRLYQELEMTKLKEADFGGNADDVIENARTIYQVYEIVISLKLMLMFFQVLPFLIIYRPLGVLTIMVQQMAQDIINWGLLFLVILGAYMMAFCGLQYAGGFNPELGENRDLRFFSAKYDIYAKDGPFAAPAFAVFGDFSINQYSGVGAIFLWSYLFISSVIMVNLLIAMFSDTFNRVKDSANEEYVHMFFDRVQEHRHVLLAPPPVLNLPYVWFDLLRYFTRSCWERSCLPNCHWMVHADRKKDAAMDILHAPKSSTSATPFTGRHSPEGSQTTQGEATESFEPEPSESLFEDSTRQSRHEEVMDSADTHTNVYDGRTLTDLYLQQKETLDSQTLAARAAHMSEAMDEAKRNHSEAFSKLESKLNKLELWMEDDKFQRETKVDPQTHDQTARIRRIEVCLDKVMQALNIQDHVAEVAPISAPNRRRRRRAPGLGSIVAASSPLPEAEQSAVVVSNFYSRRQTAAPAPFGM